VAEHREELVLGAVDGSASARAASWRPKRRAFWMATAACSASRTQIISSLVGKARGARLLM